jgi:hypothetical protein
MVSPNIYCCDACGAQLQGRGDGLKTFTCPKHRARFVTVSRDLSGGKEDRKDARHVGVTRSRHTLVSVRKIKKEVSDETK